MSLPQYLAGTEYRYRVNSSRKIIDTQTGLEVPTYIKEPYLGPLVDLEVDGGKKTYLASVATSDDPFLSRAYFSDDEDLALPNIPPGEALMSKPPVFIPGTQFRYWVGTTGKITDAFTGLEVPTYTKEPYIGPLVDLEVGREKWTCLVSSATSDTPCLTRAFFPGEDDVALLTRSEDPYKENPYAPKEERALRHNSGKPLTCCINPSLLLETGSVFTKGAEKYAVRNYQKSIGTESHDEYLESVRESMMRHVYKYLSGEKLDSETGLSHLAHMVANASIASEYEGFTNE